MRSTSMRRVFALALLLSYVPAIALAGGRRDLDDGIAFYESLDTERAEERLKAASTASDLGPKERSRAFLYLGMLQFEAGNPAEADASWKSALNLDPSVEPPDGTSPKTIEAIETARASVSRPPSSLERGSPDQETDSGRSSTDRESTGKELPATAPVGQGHERGFAPDADGTGARSPDPIPSPAATSDAPDWLLWGSIGGGVVVLGLLAIILAGSGGGCEGEGGCLGVTFQ